MGEGAKILFQLGPVPITETIVVTWLIMAVLVIFSISVTRNLKRVPKGWQHMGEIIVEGVGSYLIDNLMGPGNRKYLPFIATMGLLVACSNLIGTVPGFRAPTADLNTTVGLALIVFLVSQIAGIRSKGIVTYIKGFFEPMFFMFPINIVGELAKPISHAFRLFGNMVGGIFIIGILFMFVPWVVPVPLKLWFDIAQGLIQAFVFTMLAVAYIAVAK